MGNVNEFVCGCVHHDDCNHDWNGPAYYVTKSGKYIDYKTHPEWIGYVDQFRQQLIRFHYDFILDDPILESGSTCSKCGTGIIIPQFLF